MMTADSGQRLNNAHDDEEFRRKVAARRARGRDLSVCTMRTVLYRNCREKRGIPFSL